MSVQFRLNKHKRKVHYTKLRSRAAFVNEKTCLGHTGTFHALHRPPGWRYRLNCLLFYALLFLWKENAFYLAGFKRWCFVLRDCCYFCGCVVVDNNYLLIEFCGRSALLINITLPKNLKLHRTSGFIAFSYSVSCRYRITLYLFKFRIR